MDVLPLVLAIALLAIGAWSIVNVNRMPASDVESPSFFRQRRGRLTIGWLFVAAGVLWLAASAT